MLNTDPARAVDQLVALGYLKFARAADHTAIRQELLASLSDGWLDGGYDGAADAALDRRKYPADCEDLAEGCISDLLKLLKKPLEQEGVKLASVKDEYRDDHYDLLLNGERRPIWGAAELALEEAQPGALWNIAARRTLELTNELLAAAGSAERLYMIYGGNDGQVILLTEPMHALLRDPALGLKPSELPFGAEALGA